MKVTSCNFSPHGRHATVCEHFWIVQLRFGYTHDKGFRDELFGGESEIHKNVSGIAFSKGDFSLTVTRKCQFFPGASPPGSPLTHFVRLRRAAFGGRGSARAQTLRLNYLLSNCFQCSLAKPESNPWYFIENRFPTSFYIMLEVS